MPHSADALESRPFSPRGITRLRVAFVAPVVLLVAGHLAWEHLNGGVASHHVLNDPTLPALSNLWGLLIVPLLAWIASARAIARLDNRQATLRFGLALFGSVCAGVALSLAFSSGDETAAGRVFLALIASGAVLPVYRAQYILGFAVGMLFTFGGVLPTAIALFVAALSAVLHLAAYPLVLRVTGRARR